MEKKKKEKAVETPKVSVVDRKMRRVTFKLGGCEWTFMSGIDGQSELVSKTPKNSRVPKEVFLKMCQQAGAILKPKTKTGEKQLSLFLLSEPKDNGP